MNLWAGTVAGGGAKSFVAGQGFGKLRLLFHLFHNLIYIFYFLFIHFVQHFLCVQGDALISN